MWTGQNEGNGERFCAAGFLGDEAGKGNGERFCAAGFLGDEAGKGGPL